MSVREREREREECGVYGVCVMNVRERGRF